MKIGELAEISGFGAKAIRYYERIGLLPGTRREANGYRAYGPDAVKRLGFVRHAQAAGLSLREVGQVLAIRDEGRAPCVHVRGLLDHHLAEIDRRLAELGAARAELATLAKRAEGVDPAACPEDLICSILVPDS